MKYLPTIAGILLGLLFVFSSVVILFHLVTPPPPPADGSPSSHFMIAFGSSGYITFVKVCELLGGLLVAIPRTRNLGLLVLGPIILNILAFHVFLAEGAGLANPMIIVIVLLALYLLWVERRAFGALVHRSEA